MKYRKKPVVIEAHQTDKPMDIELPTLPISPGLAGQSDSSLRKGIRNHKKEIEIHKDKIKNPKKHYPNWDEFDEREKKGYIKHWKKEINNFEISIKRKEQELKRRGVHD